MLAISCERASFSEGDIDQKNSRKKTTNVLNVATSSLYEYSEWMPNILSILFQEYWEQKV